jgi:hypothetical protein
LREVQQLLPSRYVSMPGYIHKSKPSSEDTQGGIFAHVSQLLAPVLVGKNFLKKLHLQILDDNGGCTGDVEVDKIVYKETIVVKQIIRL